uniref:Inactive poly [ADP-ribose] polymerase RCD1-like n=1 Tax=Kalanchoe fedtschenkoi TaxID=63787 RepID=A0A7N0UYD6_KALFE
MESVYASVALKSCQLVDHVDKAQSDLVLETPVVGNKHVSQSADFKSNSSFCKLGKRKRQGEVRRCSGSVTSPLKNYAKFMKSGPLSRLLYHQDGEWVDFPNEVTELVRKKFQMKHAVVDVELEDSRFILDVMYMRKLDFQTGLQKPIAWIDDAGSYFFPEIYGEDDETQELRQCGSVDKSTTQDIKLHLQIEFSGVNDDKVDENVDELRAFKKTRVGESLNDYHNINENESNDSYNDTENNDSESGNAVADNIKDGSYANLDRRIPKIAGSASTEVNFVHNDVDFNEVSSLFIAGMGNFSCASVVEIKRCFGKLMQNRLKLFEKQVELTEKSRGSSNVQYAWLPCSKKDESSFMTYGLRLDGLPSIASYGHGVHLSSKKYAYASVKNCDDDENGVRRMLLCRVILGNIEPVHFGLDQFCPSSDQFDTGVDNILEPRTYVVWEVNALTHIYPEYVVSFKLPSIPEVGAFGAQVRKSEVSGVITSPVCPQLQFVSSNASGLDYHPDNHFQNEHQRCTPTRTPKSPWMPFPLLFESISKKVSPKTMNVVYYHYNQFKCKNIISRGEFIKRLRLAVGDPLLKSTITSLQCKQPNLPSCHGNLKAPKAEPEA